MPPKWEISVRLNLWSAESGCKDLVFLDFMLVVQFASKLSLDQFIVLAVLGFAESPSNSILNQAHLCYQPFYRIDG